MFISLVNYKKNVLVSTILAMTLYVPALRCYAQQCQTTNMKVIAKGGRPANDFKSIFTMEDKTFGLLFHKCFRRCEMNEQCIGLEICKMSEDVFRCQACCKWKKRRNYGFSAGSSDCTYYEQVSLYIHFCFIISTFVLKYTKKRNGLNSLRKICTIRRFPFYFGVFD